MAGRDNTGMVRWASILVTVIIAVGGCAAFYYTNVGETKESLRHTELRVEKLEAQLDGLNAVLSSIQVSLSRIEANQRILLDERHGSRQ